MRKLDIDLDNVHELGCRSFTVKGVDTWRYAPLMLVMMMKHGNLNGVDVSGSKASTKHLEYRLEVIQGHAFWDH